MALELLISNCSEHVFQLDGSYFSSGEWAGKMPPTVLAAEGPTCIPLSGSSIKAVFWFVSQGSLNRYFSLAVKKDLVGGNIYFSAWAGSPPYDLKAMLSKAPALGKEREYGTNCDWKFDSPECIHVKILPDMEAYEGPEEISQGEAGTAGPSKEVDLWNSTRPKNMWSGVKSGFGNLGKGLAGGVGVLVGSTVVGAKEGGGLGFVKGLGVGVLGGAVVTVGGVAAGATQIVRGVGQEFHAHKHRKEGKVWDQDTGSWIRIDLVTMINLLNAENSDDEDTSVASHAPDRVVVDMEYYHLVGVPASATPAEIKKGYYKKAREVHPDKHPDDPEAHQNFQKLAEAYQVLSDPELRQKYDTVGKEAVQDKIQTVDPAAFFSILFGSEKFEGYTGTIQLASTASEVVSHAMKEETGIGDASDPNYKGRRKQWRREVKCCIFLLEKLERYVLGRNEQGFRDALEAEAVELLSTSYGAQLLAVLGNMYECRARLYLTEELDGRYSIEKTKANASALGTKWTHRANLVGSVLNSVNQVRKIQSEVDKATRKSTQTVESGIQEDGLNTGSSNSNAQNASDDKTGIPQAKGNASVPTSGDPKVDAQAREAARDAAAQAAAQKQIEEALPVFLKAAWSATVMDLDKTLKMVARNILKDQSVPWQITIRRAEAMLIIGKIFSQVSKNSPEDKEPPKTAEQFQEALIGSLREKK